MQRSSRKIVLYIATSLDGKIASSDGSIGWLDSITVDCGTNEWMKSIGTVLMGRTTYEQVSSFPGEYPYKQQKNYIFSTTKGSFKHGIAVNPSNLNEFVHQIKSEASDESNEKDIWLIGGGKLIENFIILDLIDEYIITIIPIILGDGVPMFTSSILDSYKRYFPSKSEEKSLNQYFQLKESKTFDESLIMLTYERLRTPTVSH